MLHSKSKGLYLLIACFLVWGITGCQKKVEIKTYSQMDQVIYPALLSQEEKSYLVFFYGNTCSACEELEPLLCEYASLAKNKKGYMPLYCLNTSNNRVNEGIIATEGDDSYENFVGTNIYNQIKIATTPALIVVEQGRVTKVISTKVTQTPKTDIKTYITNLKK